MLHLLDANVLITANNLYYSLERVPQFWTWLVHQGQQGRIKVPMEIYEEIADGKTDALSAWARDPVHRDALEFPEEVNPVLVARVTSYCYAPDLTDDEVEKIGRDPFIIAYALADTEGRCVVTTEVSKPTKLRANRHVPDACRAASVRCMDTFELLQALNFSTNWERAAV